MVFISLAIFFLGHEAKRTWKRLAFCLGAILAWSCGVSCRIFKALLIACYKCFKRNKYKKKENFATAKLIATCSVTHPFPRFACAGCFCFFCVVIGSLDFVFAESNSFGFLCDYFQYFLKIAVYLLVSFAAVIRVVT